MEKSPLKHVARKMAFVAQCEQSLTSTWDAVAKAYVILWTVCWTGAES